MLVTPDAEHRPFTILAVWWTLIVVYESVLTHRFGGTVGKLAVKIRIVELDEMGRCSPSAAFRRAAVGTTLELVPFIGWAILLGNLTDALGRGVADRAAGTIAIRRDSPVPIRSRDLPGFADHLRPPRISPYGRVADLDVRARARLRRLHDSPVLVILTAGFALAAVWGFDSPRDLVLLMLAWIFVFVIDETVRIARSGATAGHRMAGLIVFDPRRGGSPSVGRSFVRALVFALSAYTIIGFIALGISALMIRGSRTGRSLHDVLAGTWVVADPQLDPEVARQRAMRMRIGKVA